MQVRSIFDSLAHIKVHFSHYFLNTRSLTHGGDGAVAVTAARQRAALVPP
jgi:hypothetical protein